MGRTRKFPGGGAAGGVASPGSGVRGAFAAVVLGATSTKEVAERAGLRTKDALVALRRLREGEVVTVSDAGLGVSYDRLRDLRAVP